MGGGGGQGRCRDRWVAVLSRCNHARSGGLEGDARLIDLIPLCGKRRAKLKDRCCTRICTKPRVGLYVPAVEDRARPARTPGAWNPCYHRESRVLSHSVSWFGRRMNSSARMALWVGFGTRLEHDRLARLRVTTLNLNLFGSPARSDYSLVIRSGLPMGKGAIVLEFVISIWSGDALGIRDFRRD